MTPLLLHRHEIPHRERFAMSPLMGTGDILLFHILPLHKALSSTPARGEERSKSEFLVDSETERRKKKVLI
jgi:hypothetical protein